MGIKLARRRFLLNRQFNYTRPLVFCCQVDGATDEAVSLNVPLAEQLARIEPDARSRRLEGCLVDCLAGQPDDVVIGNFDILFNPTYQVDVVALLVSAYRRYRFDVLWPGTLVGNELVYAEEGYPDYRTYDINRYDITCIC